MCLAILKPAKLVIPDEHLQGGWQNNPDGAGFAYVRKGKVHIEKGFMNYPEFLAAYHKAFNANKGSPFLIHFRIGTSGDKNALNTHPFPLTGGALIHNGGFTGTGADWSKGPSDTNLFAQKYKDTLSHEFITKAGDKLCDALGYNKVVTLYDDGKYAIVNEKNGQWVNDIWYSNGGFRAYTRYSTPGYRAPATFTTSPGAANVNSIDQRARDYYERHYGTGSYGVD